MSVLLGLLRSEQRRLQTLGPLTLADPQRRLPSAGVWSDGCPQRTALAHPKQRFHPWPSPHTACSLPCLLSRGEAPCAPSHSVPPDQSPHWRQPHPLPPCDSSGLLSPLLSKAGLLGPPPPQLVPCRSLPCPRAAFPKHRSHPDTVLLRTPQFQNRERSSKALGSTHGPSESPASRTLTKACAAAFPSPLGVIFPRSPSQG